MVALTTLPPASADVKNEWSYTSIPVTNPQGRPKPTQGCRADDDDDDDDTSIPIMCLHDMLRKDLYLTVN